MLKELFLIPRLSLDAALLFAAVLVVPFFSLKAFLALFLLVIAYSLLFQYYVLHFGLKLLELKYRALGLFGWMMLAVAIGAWALHALSTLDDQMEESAFLLDFSWKMTVYVIGVSMYIAGACARRAFDKHNAW